MKIRSGKYKWVFGGESRNAWSFEDDAGNTAEVPELLCLLLMRLGAMAQRDVGLSTTYSIDGGWNTPDFLAVLKRESEK